MLGPVELDPSRDPRSRQSYQRRLDHTVVIYKIIIVRLIQSALDTAAELREDHDLEIVIFQPDSMPGFIGPGEADILCGRVRIEFSA